MSFVASFHWQINNGTNDFPIRWVIINDNFLKTEISNELNILRILNIFVITTPFLTVMELGYSRLFYYKVVIFDWEKIVFLTIKNNYLSVKTYFYIIKVSPPSIWFYPLLFLLYS